ncbi:MAG: hypothetical protein AAGA17_16765 [Actinomycetota bacterium]
MEAQEFRASRGLAWCLLAATLALAVVGIVADVSSSSVLLLGAATNAYPLVLALRTRIVVDDDGPVEVRWTVRSTSFDRSDVLAVRRNRRGIRLDIRNVGVTRILTLPAVSDTDGLERALCGHAPALDVPERPELVIHQGGLARRWAGSTYVVEG